jgi:hypothetical protein
MIPQASTFLERVRVASGRTRDLSRMAAWLCEHTKHPKNPKKPWTFLDHEMQRDIANETRHHVLVRKCSQVGLSELSVRISLGMLAIFPGTTAIYTLPTAKFAAKFTKSRINTVVDASKTLSDLVPSGTDSSELKQFGTSFLYIVGTSGQSSPISIPADMLIRDEVDFSNQSLLSMFFSRLGHAQGGGWIRDFSTPTVDNYGISAEFDDSSQGRYVIKCSCCSEKVMPTFIDDVVIPGFDNPIIELEAEMLTDPRYDFDGAWLKCPACGGELTMDALTDVDNREWVHALPGADLGGYQVMPFDVPFINPIAKTVKSIKQYERKSDWVNFEMGVPYEDSENSFLESVITANTCLSHVKPGAHAANGCVAGLDIGKTSWLLIGKPVTAKKVDIIHAEKIVQNEDAYLITRALDLLKWYGVTRMVMDAGPDFTSVTQIIARAIVNQVYGCYYVRSAGKSLSDIAVKEAEQVITASRVGTFDTTAKAVNRGDVRFARMPEMTTVAAHLRAMKRVSHKNAAGETVTAWASTGADHFAHALNYLMISIQLGVYLDSNSAPIAPPTMLSARFGGIDVDEEPHPYKSILR